MVDIVLQRILECIGNKHGEAKKLALYLGIHPNVITNWKNGTNKSYKKHINQIADYFGVSVGYLLGEEEENTKSDDNFVLEKAYFSIAKDAQESGLDPRDIQLIIDTLKKNRNK